MRVTLPHTLVYWPPAGADQYGGPTYGRPVQYACRWDDGHDETIDRDGNLVYSSASVILLNVLQAGGMVMLGKLVDTEASGFPSNLREVSGVREILSVTKNPSLRNSMSVVTVQLK